MMAGGGLAGLTGNASGSKDSILLVENTNYAFRWQAELRPATQEGG